MLIKIKVLPNSKKQGIIKKSEDSFEVRVKAKPIEGKANKEMIEVLSCYFKIPEKKIRLIRGFRQRNKIVRVDNE